MYIQKTERPFCDYGFLERNCSAIINALTDYDNILIHIILYSCPVQLLLQSSLKYFSYLSFNI